MTEEIAALGAHSPVGASSAKRIKLCPASVGLSVGAGGDGSEHASLGTSVHALIEYCFARGTDAWQHIGQSFEGMRATRDMAMSAQAFLDAVRTAHPERTQANFGVERKFRCPSIHPLFYGTTDAWYLDEEEGALHIWDFKNGAGVVVEAKGNDQGQYYAVGMLETLMLWDRAGTVVIHIVQPNAYHRDGPVREWATTPGELALWLEGEMLPAIVFALGGEGRAASGEHCRFCPARARACPQILADMEELEGMTQDIRTKGGADHLTPEQVGRFLSLLEVAKIAGKAANATAYHRLQAGVRIPGWKLVRGKANRTWKDGAGEAARGEFGAQALTAPELKSPAEIDKLPKGGDFTARWAEKPDAGLTVAKADDPRAEVSEVTKSLFTPVGPASAPGAEAPEPSVPVAGTRRARKPADVVDLSARRYLLQPAN